MNTHVSRKIRYAGLFFIFVTSILLIDAQKILINTARSQYSYLQSDVCNYDDETNSVICTTYGAFQNIKKVPSGQAVSGAMFIGSFSDAQGKGNDLYALNPQQALAQQQDMLNNIKAVAAVLFNPVETVIGGKPTPNPYATDSLNAKSLDALLGPNGLKVDATIIQYFKNFYFYLEYVIRIDMAARIIALATQQKIDWLTVIDTKSWQDFMNLMESKAGNWNNLESMIYKATIVPNWDNLKGIVNASSWKDLVETPFWKSFNGLTTTSIKNSTFWQKYLKYIVARSFVQDQNLLLSIKEIEETIFKYIPNIEIAYYNPDFTSLRNASEMFRISMVLTDAYRMRHIAPINDWNSFKVSQNNFDLLKINTAAQDFQKTGFYQIAALSEDNPNVVYNAVAQNKVPFDSSLFTQEPLLQEELLLLSMIKILHGLTNYLFDSDHLETTMNVLANQQISKPIPSIFIYAPEDYLYLEDINHVHDSFKQVATQPAQTSLASKQDTAKKLLNLTITQQKPIQKAPQNIEVQGLFNHLWNDIKNAGEKVWSDVKKIGKDAVSFANSAGEAIWSEAESLGFGVAGVFLSGIDPALAQKLLNDSKKLQSEVSDDIDKATKSLQNTVTDIEDAAHDSAAILAKVIEDVCIGATFDQDEEICKSYAGAFETEFDIVINIIASNIHQTIAIAGGVIKLTADGVKIIADSAADVMTGNLSDLGSDLVNDLKQIGADAAVAVLTPLTYSFKYLMKDLAYALKYAQYFISILTRLFIDATTAITYAIGATVQGFAKVFGVDIDPSEWAKTVDQTLSEHERVIGTAITTALLLATIPLTGGASVPMVAMIVGPQIFAGFGSYQADELAADQLHEEKEFVNDYQIFVQNNEVIYQQQQQEWANELDAKYKSELANQERGLGFYENFVSTNFEAVEEQMASALGSYWTGLLTPDKNNFNLVPGDVGSIYGISTGVYDLNPSQGFALYSAARNSFSQEIAVSPAIAYQQDDGVTSKVETKNWFNQKEVALLEAPISEVEIRFKPIYLLNSFYVGLYFGGQEINPAQIVKTQQAPLDMAQLAKMAVYKKEDSQSPVTFGVYEHEGKQEWLANSVQAPQFKLDNWYHIKMQLNDTTLLVKVWAEPEEEPSSWQTYTVALSPSQKIIGVISSGASIEYQFIKPAMNIVPNSTIRPENSRCTIPCNLKNPSFVALSNEQERESIAQSGLSYLINPKIGIFALQATSKPAILKGHYIYTTQATQLMINNKIVTDYVILCQVAEFGDKPDIVSGTIGQRPQEGSALISLISETVYNSDGTQIQLKLTNLFDTYVKQFGPLSSTLMNQLTALRKTYAAQLMAITFGPFKLQAADQQELMQHHYIYKMALTDAKGTPLKDSAGKPVNDYYLFTILDTNNPPSYLIQRGNPGISPSVISSDKTQNYGIISLTSGNLYGSANKTPVNTGFSPTILLKNFEQNYGTINAALKNAIVASHQAYLAVEQSSENTATPDTGAATHTTDPNDMGTKTDHKGTNSLVMIPLQPPADQSAQQRSDDAGGGDVTFGGP